MNSARTSAQPRRSRGALRFWAPLIALWAVPPLALVLVVPWASSTEESAVATGLPAVVTVGERTRTYSQRVTAEFMVTTAPAPEVATGGVVTAIHRAAGDELPEGAALVSVDGVEIRVHRGAPFHRDLGQGLQGSDVTELARYLTQAGFPCAAGPGATVNARVVTAIRSYQKAVGAIVDGTFRPGYVVFLSPETTTSGTLTTSVGSRVDSGDPLFTGVTVPQALSILPDQNEALRVGEAPGPYLLRVEGTQIPLTTLTPDAAETSVIYRALLELGARPADTGTESTGASTSTDGSVSTPHALSTEKFPGVSIEVATPVSVGTVPTASVYATAQGVRCVFTTPGTSKRPTAATAVVLTSAGPLEGEIAVAAIDHALTGQTIIRDPFSLDAATLHGCS